MDKLGKFLFDRVVSSWQSSSTGIGMGLLAFLEFYKDQLAGTNTKAGLYSGLGVLILTKILGKDGSKETKTQ